MSDVNETLQQLLQRRLLEMGKGRGRDEPLTLKEAHDALPAQIAGEKPATREAVRRVVVDGHTNISPRTARTIATMFDLTEGEVLAAAGKRVPLGRFELPEEADRLEPHERDVVLGVVDAILRATAAPNDIDVCVIAGAQEVVAVLDEIQPLLTVVGPPRVQPMSGLVDGFLVVPEMGDDVTYWTDLWTSIRGSDGNPDGRRKGYVEVTTP